ncbi:MAG: PBP1A family penicillin-binding protein [Spirochaetes bacterium]|nr:PBP1A family penicillin-binding protein [Spirochaetota bacterium]
MKLKFINILTIILFAGTILAGITIGVVFASFSRIDIEKIITEKQLSIPTIIYDINGKVIDELFQEKREIIPFRDIPENLIKAFIAYEDKDFYKHHGFNTKRILISMLYNIKRILTKQKGTIVGGSTITQQLAKRLFTESEKTIYRKLRELWYTVQIEKKFSKNEILEFYLNEVYFGHGVYGIKTASEFYFGKNVKDLTLAECALLATLPQSPVYNSPILYPENSKKRVKMALDRMIELNFVSKEEAQKSYEKLWESLSERNFASISSPYFLSKSKAPYYTDAVLNVLKNDFTPEDIYKKGLRIYTACNLDYQVVAEKYLKEALEKLNAEYSKSTKNKNDYIINNYLDIIDFFFEMNNIQTGITNNKANIKYNKFYKENVVDFINLLTQNQNSTKLANIFENYKILYQKELEKNFIQGAIVSIEPSTGYVLVLVGGYEWTKQDQLNRALRVRFQPGSGIKPFIYAGALEKRIITPSTVILDAPIIYQFSENDIWTPSNYDGQFSGYVRVRDALRKSINIPAIKVMEALGISETLEYLSKFYSVTNIFEGKQVKNKSDFPPYLSTALGTISISPLQAAKAFSIFANKGKEVYPIIVRYVTDREGRIIKNYEQEYNQKLLSKSAEEIQIVSPQTAFLISSILKDAAAPGGTAYASLSQFKLDFDFAVKTGTTQNWKDAWMNGYTDNLTTIVWIGFDRASSLGLGYTGGYTCGPIWGKFMQYIYQILKRAKPKFSVPSGIIALTIDSYSGLLSSPNSPRSYTEYFIAGTQPKTYASTGGLFLLSYPTRNYYSGQESSESSANSEEESGSFFKTPSDND